MTILAEQNALSHLGDQVLGHPSPHVAKTNETHGFVCRCWIHPQINILNLGCLTHIVELQET